MVYHYRPFHQEHYCLDGNQTKMQLPSLEDPGNVKTATISIGAIRVAIKERNRCDQSTWRKIVSLGEEARLADAGTPFLVRPIIHRGVL